VFKDYDVAINTPYAGSLVPNKFYMKDNRVKSVMIEINKRLHLEADNITKVEFFNRLTDKIKSIKDTI